MANNQTSSATNLTGPNLSASTLSSNTNQYFNNFYSFPMNVSAETNDYIVAFFEEYASNSQTAQTMAASVIYTAKAQGLDPLTVMKDFQALPKGQLNNYLVAFLNITRVPTSILGLNKGAQVSPFITRTIIL
jgi:hypothetical protein